MLAYVNNYDDSFINDAAYKRHRRLQDKREMEQRREAILNRYLKPAESEVTFPKPPSETVSMSQMQAKEGPTRTEFIEI